MKKNRDKQIQQHIMEEIEKGEVKMRPWIWFWLQKMGLVALAFLCFTGVGITLALVDWWLRDIGGAQNLWGEFADMLWDDFPGYWLALSLVACLVGVILYGKIGDNYKKTAVVKYTIIVALVTAMAMVIIALERRLT